VEDRETLWKLTNILEGLGKTVDKMEIDIAVIKEQHIQKNDIEVALLKSEVTQLKGDIISVRTKLNDYLKWLGGILAVLITAGVIATVTAVITHK